MTYLLTWLFATIIIGSAISLTAKKWGAQMLSGVYVGSLVIAIVVAGKLGSIPGLPGLTLSASIFVYSATFIFTDVLSEVWGKQVARRTVFAGALMYPLIFLSTQMAIDWSPHPFWVDNQEAFAATMGTTLRIVVASFLAFVASQLHDVWAFDYWKTKTNGKHLWLRNNASTMTSQLIDTIVFYAVGFYGVFPIGKLILFTYLIKLVIAAIDTPFVYAIVAYLRKSPSDEKDLIADRVATTDT